MRWITGSGARRGRSSVALAGLVAVLGLVVSAGAGAVLAAGQRDAVTQQLERRATLVAEAVASETGRYVDTLRTIAATMSVVEPLTAATFTHLAQPLRDMRLAGATSVVYLVPADDNQVAGVQALWRTRGVPDLVLERQNGAGEHIFSIFSEPLDGATALRSGVDVTQSAAPTQALAEARRSGQVTVSDAYHLIIDHSLPAGQRQMSFALTVPVYSPEDAQGERSFRGWVLMGLRGQDFIGATLSRIPQNAVDVTLEALTTDGRQVAVATLRAPVPGRRDLLSNIEVPVADRHWQLRVRASGIALPGGSTGLPSVATLGGAVFALLLAGLVCVIATGRARAQAQVRAAIAELAVAEAEARRQATLLEAVMNSIGDGVGVVDESGDFILHNLAAKAMLGLADKGGPEHWQEPYGTYLPDGVTPFPTEELPLVRALAGEATEHAEMIIRNAARPEGITITVSGRPLDAAAGQAGAVAVFHDVTVLRERDADLRAFADVAAHDLKAPLAVIAGFAEILDDDLAGGADPVALRRTLARLRTGVERMRRLIDDLLAYATARDAQLRLEPVDLQSLVSDVIAERTAHLRAGRTTEGRPALFPDIYTGALPVVQADRAMARQLLDNLIGNALKYTLPGQPARIDISAQPVDDGRRVCVEIADRGIGIPSADQPHVFKSFHRAASHAGYTGTGLGLAICQRVVDRHGGTIGVADNPGGGTRVHFTLPAAATSPASPPASPGVVRRAEHRVG